jgi:hypothetical protein
MRAITIQVSDSDYADLVQHLATDRIGTPLVGVRGLPAFQGSDLRADIVRYVEEQTDGSVPWVLRREGRLL